MFKKIRNKVNSAVAAVRATVACKKAEGYAHCKGCFQLI